MLTSNIAKLSDNEFFCKMKFLCDVRLQSRDLSSVLIWQGTFTKDVLALNTAEEAAGIAIGLFELKVRTNLKILSPCRCRENNARMKILWRCHLK